MMRMTSGPLSTPTYPEMEMFQLEWESMQGLFCLTLGRFPGLCAKWAVASELPKAVSIPGHTYKVV